MLDIKDFINELHDLKIKHGLDGFYFSAVKCGEVPDSISLAVYPEALECREQLDDEVDSYKRIGDPEILITDAQSRLDVECLLDIIG